MSSSMKSLTGCLTLEYIRSLATASNLRLGREIVKSHGVEFMEIGPDMAVARVQPEGGVSRTTELHFTEQRLAWKCTCTSTRLFCKHCVALAITARDKLANL
jgi:uncharacterized Zn finger protein